MAKSSQPCEEVLGDVQCSRPLGHKGTHWSVELPEKHPEYFIPAHISKEAIAAKSSAAPATPEMLVRDLFERAGFRVIRMVKEDFWLLHPIDKQESEIHGSMCMSPRAFAAIAEFLLMAD